MFSFLVHQHSKEAPFYPAGLGAASLVSKQFSLFFSLDSACPTLSIFLLPVPCNLMCAAAQGILQGPFLKRVQLFSSRALSSPVSHLLFSAALAFTAFFPASSLPHSPSLPFLRLQHPFPLSSCGLTCAHPWLQQNIGSTKS